MAGNRSTQGDPAPPGCVEPPEKERVNLTKSYHVCVTGTTLSMSTPGSVHDALWARRARTADQLFHIADVMPSVHLRLSFGPMLKSS